MKKFAVKVLLIILAVCALCSACVFSACNGTVAEEIIEAPKSNQGYNSFIDYSFLYTDEDECPSGNFTEDKLEENRTFELGKTNYALVFFTLKDLSVNDWIVGDKFKVKLSVSPCDYVTSKLEEASTGTFTEKTDGQTRSITLTYTVPELKAEQSKTYRIALAFSAQKSTTAEIDLSFCLESEDMDSAPVVADCVTVGTNKFFDFVLEDDGYAICSAGDEEYGANNCYIPTYYKNKKVIRIQDKAFSICRSIEKVTIPDGITDIGEYAFSYCSELTDVTIPASVKSFGKECFYYSRNLANVNYLGDMADWCSIKFGNSSANPLNYASDFYVNDKSVEDLVISDGVTGIGNYSFSGYLGLNSVVIEDGVTNIGSSAFYNCCNLRSVSISASVTDIGNSAFSGCSGLTDLTMECGVTNIADSAFKYCSSLTSVIIPDSVESISEQVFSHCNELSSVTIPYGVKGIASSAFEYCGKLKSVIIPDSVTSVGASAFSNCSSLESISVPFVGASEGGTSNTHFGYIFGAGTYSENSSYVPASLKSVVISGDADIDTSAFSGCSGLTSVSISGNVTNIGKSAFYNCSGLTSVSIADGVNNIDSSAFYNCSSLTDVIIPDSVESIGGDAFRCCTSLKSITLPFVGNTKYSSSKSYFGYVFGAESYSESYLYIPKTLKTVVITGETIGSNAFYGCSGLTSVTIGNGVTGISSNAFYNCTGLADFIIPDSVTSIGESAFYNCTGLTGVIIPDSVTSIGKSAFYNCTGLAGVIIPDSVTSIGESAFYGCTGLTGVIIPDSVESIGSNSFSGCTSLESITLPFVGNTKNSANYNYFGYIFGASSYINNYVSVPSTLKTVVITGETIGSNAFYGCSGLTSVTVGNGVTSIGSSAFYNCSGLTSVTVGNGVTSIGSSAFYNCSGLTSITVGNSVTSIGSSAFYNCSGLTSITVGNGVTSIGSSAFSNCSGLTSITVGNSVTSIGSSAFSDCGGLTRVDYTGDMGGWCGISFGGTSGNPLSVAHNFYINDELVTNLVIPDGVTSIGSYAFSNYSGLTSVTIGNGVTSIGSSAFSDCSGLTSVTIGNRVTDICDYAFYDCRCLTNVTIGKGVTSIGTEAFYKCYSLFEVKNLSSLTITAGSEDNGHSGYYAKRIYYTGESYLSVDEDGYIIYDDGTDRIIVKYTGTEKELTVPGDISQINHYAFLDCSSLKSIEIPDGVKAIGYSAFGGCSSLESITVPFVGEFSDGTGNTYFGYIFGVNPLNTAVYNVPKTLKTVVVTGETSIGERAFSDCSGLTSVTIGNSVTGIGANAFVGCYSLESISLPFVGATRDGTISSKFSYIFSSVPIRLKTVEITGETSIKADAFSWCGNLRNVILGDGVTEIENGAFNQCGNLISVTMGSGLTSIGYNAFYYCNNLTDVYFTGDIADWCGISGLGNLMSGNVRLFIDGMELQGELVIPDGVESIGEYAFRNCIGLTSVTIPDSVTWVGNRAFSDCSGLTKVNYTGDIVGWCGISFGGTSGNPLSVAHNLYINDELVTDLVIPDGVTSIGSYAFFGCSSLTNVVIPDSVKSIYQSTFGACPMLESITVPFVGAAVDGTENTHFGYIFGANSYSYNSVYVPSTLKTVVVTGGESIGFAAFRGCYSLENLTIPFVGNTKDGTTNTHFSYIFGASSYIYKCVPESLKTVVITGGTKIDDNAFNSCKYLTNVTLPDGITSIGENAFLNCSALTDIVIPGSVTKIGYHAFYNCYRLIEIKNQSDLSITAGSDGNGYVGYYAKRVYSSGESYLSYDENGYLIYDDGTDKILVSYTGAETELTVPDYITQINHGAFLNMRDLTEVIIPEGVTGIGDYAFSDCFSLTAVTLPDSLTGIGYSAFCNCSALTSITIPDKVSTINNYTFENCSALTSVIIPDNVTSIGIDAFSDCISLASVTVGKSVKSISISSFSNCVRLIEVKNLSSLTITAGSKENGYVGYYAKRIYTEGDSFLSTDENGFTVFDDGVDKVLVSVNSTQTDLIIPDGTTQVLVYAFKNCAALTNITIPDSVVSIGKYGFINCYGLTNVYYLGGVADWCGITFIDCFSNPLYFAQNLYINGELLTDMVIPEGVTSIGDYAFSSCSSLTSVVIPEGVTSIGDYAFRGCSGLTSVVIPEGVTSIGDYAFSGCSSLTSVTIPESVTSIGKFAFDGCSSLTSVTFKNTSGWQCFSSETATSGTAIDSAVLSDVKSSASYLSDLYTVYIWRRS
ncbi:MAG: leucine-rich repeat domain-containing protein [Candidatus Coproplasma sp.]